MKNVMMFNSRKVCLISSVFWSEKTFRVNKRLVNEFTNSSITYLYCCFNHRIMIVALQYVLKFHCIIISLSYLIISFLIVLFLTSFLFLKMKTDLHQKTSLTKTYNIKITCLKSHSLRWVGWPQDWVSDMSDSRPDPILGLDKKFCSTGRVGF